MSTVSSVNSIGATTAASSQTTNPNSVMGKDDFLKLLIAQMQNQDPMNPMDGTQYAAQLAQFSSLEQLQNLNDNIQNSISANLTLTQSINNTMSAGMIGKQAKIDSPDITVNGQSAINLGIDLSANSSSVIFKILDPDGNLVKTIEKDGLKKGENKLSWDLTDNNGYKVANGAYTFSVTATSTTGDTMSDKGYQYGLISGVKYTESGAKFLVNGTEFDLSSILEILNATN